MAIVNVNMECNDSLLEKLNCNETKSYCIKHAVDETMSVVLSPFVFKVSVYSAGFRKTIERLLCASPQPAVLVCASM